MTATQNPSRIARILAGTTGAVAAPLATVALLCVSGCSSAKPEIARAAVASELGASSAPGSTQMCPLGLGMSWVAIGSDTDDPISNGSKYMGDPVNVACSVHPSSGNFIVTLSAELEGQGSISVADAMISSDTSTVNTGITGIFGSATISGDFTESACTWDFGGQSTDLDPSETAGNPLGVAAGRIWGNLTCPMIMNSENGNVCLAQAELRFENCGE